MNAEYFARVARRRTTEKHLAQYWSNPSVLHTEENDAREMARYLEDCRAAGDWDELCRFTHCTVQVLVEVDYL